MINYACPKCREPLQAPEDRLGTVQPCPNCKFQVQVPLVTAKSGATPLVILGILGGLAVVAVPMCIIVCLVAIQILGKNANSAFGTVGTSIGATVSSGRPSPP